MKGKYVELVRSLRDPVRARRQEKIREVELTWSDHDLSNFRVFALGLQPGEMADVCHALADGSAIPLLELLVDYTEVNDELMQIAFQSLDKTPLSARLFLSKRLLSSKTAMVRAAACRMLSGAGPAAERLEAALDDESELVVAAAIRALVSIGYVKAEKKILAHLRHGGDKIRLLAIDAMVSLNDRSRGFEKTTLAILANADETPELREKAARALSRMKSDDGRAVMLDMLDDSALDVGIRCVVAGALGDYVDVSVAEALLNAGKGEPRALASASLQALSRMNSSVVLPVCERCLAGKDSALALAAVELLGGLGVKGATRALSERLAVEDEPARIAGIAEALGKSGDPGAWGALRQKLAERPDQAVALVSSLADCATRDNIDEFAALVDILPRGGPVEIALRRLAAFCRSVKPTPAVLERALAMVNSSDPVMTVPAVEILAYSGEPSLRTMVLVEMARLGKGFPTRRLLRVMLGHCGGELATLFSGVGPETSVLVAEAAAEAESMGRGGMELFINLASWVRHGAVGAREGLAAAAALEPWHLVEAMRLSPDRVFLLEAWAGLPRRERLRNQPDLDHLFASCGEADKLFGLEILSRIGEEGDLRTVSMLAFNERDPGIKNAALALVRRLLESAAGDSLARPVSAEEVEQS